MLKKIVVVEDDFLQLAWIVERLKEAFPNHEIKQISSESAFRAEFLGMQANPPAVVIMDMMLRWSDPRTPRPKPPEMAYSSSHLAGIRCIDMLAQNPTTAKVPIVIYTIFDACDFNLESLRPGVEFLSKSMDARPLIAGLSALL